MDILSQVGADQAPCMAATQGPTLLFTANEDGGAGNDEQVVLMRPLSELTEGFLSYLYASFDLTEPRGTYQFAGHSATEEVA